MSFVIFQPDRYWLKKLISGFGHYLTGRMLDIGAGEVDRYAKFFKHSERVTTDIHAGPNVDVVASADKLPFEENSFNSVVCTQVLEHVPNPRLVVQEIQRVVKRGGFVLVSIPLTAELHEEPNDYWRYTKYGIEHLFMEHGFEVVENKQEGGYYSMISHIRIRHAINKYRLFEKPFIGRIFGKIFQVYGRFMIWRDEKSNNAVDLKHTLGYVLVVKKV